MTTESSLSGSRHGTKSYRGRSLEEILPQIRAELGPDAVILREREGLVGGVGGFFAQRFIEVEARRGDGQSIDVYDDTPEPDAGALAVASVLESLGLQPTAPGLEDPHEPRPFIPPALSSKPEPEVAALPRARAEAEAEAEIEAQAGARSAPAGSPPAPTPAPVAAPVPRRFETGIFMERLREASAMLPDDFPEPEPAAPKLAEAPPRPKLAEARPEPGLAEAEPTAGPDPLSDLAADISAREAVAASRDVNPQPSSAQREPEPKATSARPAPAEPSPARAAPERPGPPRSASARPASLRPTSPRPTPPRATSGRPAPPLRPAQPRPAQTRQASAAPSPPRTDSAPQIPSPVTGPRRDPRPSAPNPMPALAEQWLPALGRLFGRRPAPELKALPPRLLDPAAAGSVSADLVSRGASQAWTDELIKVAGAHGNPLAKGLRAAAQAELARRILPAPALPSGGAAVAFIGGGGSGKTRCTAAMASAYRRNSTLTVTVIALDDPDGARHLRMLLREDGVPVLAVSGDEARREVEAARRGGLVIVDTPAVTPTDPTDVAVLGARLAPLALDATYVAMPATLAPSVAGRALDSFRTLRPAAVTITHADETDQLAAVVEVAMKHGIPLAHVHAGTDHQSALSAVSPAAFAAELLP